MYEGWYTQQNEQYSDAFSSQFEIFGIKSQTFSNDLGSLERLSAREIMSWLGEGEDDLTTHTQNTTSIISPSTFRMILTRHREYRYEEIKPGYLAFDKETFANLMKVMKLPSSYSYMRVNAGASGNFAKYSTCDENGAMSRLSFVIRIPHSPRATAKAIWSLAVSWEANACSTTSLFESLSDEDMQEVYRYISSSTPHHRQHPLFLPTMLLNILNTFYVSQRKILEQALYYEESGVGITRGSQKADVWDWSYERQRDATKRFHILNTGLVFLERRLDFASQLGEFVLRCLTYCEEEDVFRSEQRNQLLRVSKELREIVENDQNFVACQQHQVLCLQKRAQALVSVMYSVVSQNDSRMNVGIAKAAKLDSSSMATIAVLGIVFLPAMLVASMFSMSMFDFSAPNSSPSSETSESGHVMVTSTFWIFWIVTIPLTLIVLAVWKVWMRRVEKSAQGDEAQMEEVITLQPLPVQQGPFYPRLRVNGP